MASIDDRYQNYFINEDTGETTYLPSAEPQAPTRPEYHSVSPGRRLEDPLNVMGYGRTGQLADPFGMMPAVDRAQYTNQQSQALKVADYLAQFLPPERIPAEVEKMTGVKLQSGVVPPNAFKRMSDIASMNKARLEAQLKQDEIDQRRPESRDDIARSAHALGVPVAPDVTRGMSRVGAERIKAQHQKDAERLIADASGESQQLQNMTRLAEQFIAMNERTTSGRISGAGPVAWARGAVSDDVSNMQSITDQLTPAMRQGLPGAASDRDVAMFRSATVGIDKPLATNRNIVSALRAKSVTEKERVRFMESYREANQGQLVGAQRAWQEYLDANPIFDTSSPSSTAAYALNTKRLPWQDWFRVREELKRRGAL